jgi:sugar lactone lactonase YvrE
MKTKVAVLKVLSMIVGGCWLGMSGLRAQTTPAITNQPVSQTNLPGANVTFTVGVAGTGPFTYQWQFNETSLPINIITVAGGGSGGDGGSAANASLVDPAGIAFDGSGNLYIADTGNQRIRKVGTNGLITTVAGNGTAAYSGDGGSATSASLNLYPPSGVALDAVGNLYIADNHNEIIRKVDTNGIIMTVAGNRSYGYSGDGGAATNASLRYPGGVALDAAGNLYIADEYNARIRKVDTNGIITTVAGNGNYSYSGDGAAATNAALHYPSGVALDPLGNLYIGDYGANRIRRVDTNGVITTVAGNGAGVYAGDGGADTNASLYNPNGVEVDGAGNLFIADQYNQRVRKVDTNGLITTVAGNGSKQYAGDGAPATNASLNYPESVASDSLGNLYIADTVNNRIRQVQLTESPSLTLSNVAGLNAGNYTVVVTSPYGIVTSTVAILTVQEPPVITVQPVSKTALAGSDAVFSVEIAGSGPFGYLWYFDSTNLVQSSPLSTLAVTGVSMNNAGNYMVVVTNDYGSVTSQVAVLTAVYPPTVTSQQATLTVLAGGNVSLSVSPNGTGPFSYQWLLNGTNLPNNLITTVAGNGNAAYAGDGGAAANAALNYPCGLAFDAIGNLYIADAHNHRIRKVGTNGIITTVAGNGHATYVGDGQAATNASLNYPWDLALDSAGNLYIDDTFNNRLRKVGTNGIISTVNVSLSDPYGVVVDAAGSLYISDSSPQCVVKVGTNASTSTVAGGGAGGDGGPATSASLNYVSQLNFDAAGNLYIADSGQERLRKVDIHGIITTVAGNGNATYAGDGGTATNASLNYPTGVVVDVYGNLYIADYYNDRIRKVDTNGIITTVAMASPGIPGTAERRPMPAWGCPSAWRSMRRATCISMTVIITASARFILPAFQRSRLRM